jgi:uncharacterized protein (TIGR02996 family)
MSAPLTNDDRAFIRAILDNPEELTTWLVYADWLDDRGDPRSEFLRLSVERKRSGQNGDDVEELETRLAVLRAALDPNWILAFDSARLANCRGSDWGYACPLKWDQLSPTDEPDIRICHSCKSPVFYCHTADEARQFSSCGQCVALSTRVPSEEWPELALNTQEIMMGFYYRPEGDDEPCEEIDPILPQTPRRPWWRFW